MRSRLLLPALAMTMAAARAASASEVALDVTGPPGCLAREALAHDIDAILGRSAILLAPSAPTARLSLSMSRAAAPDTYTALLTLLTADGRPVGTRELVRSGPSCAVLDGPLAVVAALLVDAAEETVRLTLPPPPPLVPAPATPSAPSSTWRLESEAAASFLVGPLPPAPGARLDLRVAPPGFVPLLVRLDAYPHVATSNAGPNGNFEAITGTLGVCPAWRRAPWSFFGCAGVTSGVVHAAGIDVPHPGESSAPLVMGTLEGGGGVRLVGPFSLVASVGAGAGAWPPNWHVDGTNGATVVVWKSWPVALLGSIGLSIDTSSEKGPPSGH